MDIDSIKSITIIEKSSDVIKLVAPTYLNDSRITIINGDAYTYQIPDWKKYDVIWHDIWDDITFDNLKEMAILEEKYMTFADWQGCWSKRECLIQDKERLGL
jgi:spermidine synthase